MTVFDKSSREQTLQRAKKQKVPFLTVRSAEILEAQSVFGFNVKLVVEGRHVT